MKLIILTVLLILISISVFTQEKSVEPFLPQIFSQFPNVRDIAISSEGDEIYFSVQSYTDEASLIVTAKKENNQNNNNIIEYEEEEELMDISQTNFDEEFTEGEEFAPEVIGDSGYPEFNPTNQAVFMQEFGDFFNKHFKLLKQIIGPNKPDAIIQKEFANIMNFSVTDLLERGMNAGEAVEVTARGFEVLMNQWQNSREIDIVKQYLNTVDKMIHQVVVKDKNYFFLR